jgi:hypothetical protein
VVVGERGVGVDVPEEPAPAPVAQGVAGEQPVRDRVGAPEHPADERRGTGGGEHRATLP